MFSSKINDLYSEIPTIIINRPSDEIKFSRSTLDDENWNDGDNFTEEGIRNKNRLPLRRNSISLPNLDDIQNIGPDVDVLEENKNEALVFNNYSDEVRCDEIGFRFPQRNVRRKSIINPAMLQPSREEDSPALSITSINSLASLLREKMQTFPATLRKKKNPDYKIKIFVGLLFLITVCLVSFAYILYQQTVLQRAYFERIKFNQAKRSMKIYNNEGREIINARLGITLNIDSANPCLPNDQIKGKICLEWMDNARLYLDQYELNSEVKCYNMKWIALSHNFDLIDCIEFSPHEQWYGGGQNAESAWQLEKGNHSFSPFITGRVDRNEWGNVLKRYFISSKGAAIIIDNITPLHTAIESNRYMCFKASYDNFAFVNRVYETAQLNYSICVSSNTTSLHSYLVENTLWDGLKQEDLVVINSLLTEPLWEIPTSSGELTEGAVGGDFKATNNENVTTELLPDKELYMRWLQLATFLPVIRFTHLPSTYGDQAVLEMAKISTSLRQIKVSPLLKKYARISLDTGFPIIRPLWMMDSNDPSCYTVEDQFSIGDDLIVAPVLHSGARQREVYLPAGVWKDGIDGSFRKGSRWIHSYQVEENEVAYFEKMPHNTRL